MKTLAKEHGWLVATQPAPGVWEVDALSGGWRLLSPGGLFVSDTYFDFKGLTNDYKTLMFDGATVQEQLAPIVVNANVGDSLIVCDVMSSSSMNDTELGNFYVYGNFRQQGSLTFDQTIYARIRQFNVDVDNQAWGSMVQLTDNQIGSLDPTASDRVYCYRIVALGTPFAGTRIDITAARYLLKASIKEEAEYEYLMRLKRSYELQYSPDRD